MRILIIGAVAAGTSAATQARRNNQKAEIVIYHKDTDISYSGCGLPYYIGEITKDFSDIEPRDPSYFKQKFNIDIFINHEVTNIDIKNNTIEIINLINKQTFTDKYDTLIIATGADSFVPEISGIRNQNVFSLRTVNDARKIKNFIDINKPEKATILGSGFLGMEMLENFQNKKIFSTIIERKDKITSNLDYDMALYLENSLLKRGIALKKKTSIKEISDSFTILSDNTTLQTDLVLIATGVKPNIDLAQKAGLNIGTTGAIKVTPEMQTSVSNIYACGDCIELFSTITGEAVYKPLGTTANKTGIIAGANATGNSLRYLGTLGTGIFQIFDMTVATTGLTELETKKLGLETLICHLVEKDKTNIFHGKDMLIKAIADKKNHTLLGAQIIGSKGVDKRIDVFATLITYKGKLEDFFDIDLAYSPPYSTVRDPVHYTGIALNEIAKGKLERKLPTKIETLIQEGMPIVE